MKLEVGMYVRTQDGKIGEVVELHNENASRVKIDCLDRWLLLHYLITKASHNIIDLIEVGDYVNGCLVVKKYEKCDYAEQCIKLKGNSNYFYDIHVYSIVTKEQFEAMQYKVVEEC